MANNSTLSNLLSLIEPADIIRLMSDAKPLDLANSFLNSSQFDQVKQAVNAKLTAMPDAAQSVSELDFSELAATAQIVLSAAGKAAESLLNFLKTDKGKITAVVVTGAAIGSAIVISLARLDPHVKWHTKYGPAFVLTERTEDGSPLRVMVVDNVYQSATYMGHRWNELPFEYYRAFDHMFEAGLPIRNTLMLGGGGFAYPKHLLTTHPEVSMDVVESDIKIIKMAMDYFYLDRLMEVCPDRLGIVENDGVAFLQTAEHTYDAIINDAFNGAQADSALATIEAANLVKARLNPNGLYLVNTVAKSSECDYTNLAELTATLEHVFNHVWIIPSTDEEFSEEENYLVIASDGDYEFADAIPY